MTHDELKAAATRLRTDDYWELQRDGTKLWYRGWRERDEKDLAGYAAAMLDETRIDRAWLVKLLGEADPPSSPSDAWWPLEGAEGIGVYWDDDAWCLYLDEGVFFVRSTRADALAFFKLVRWPVEPGKILEGAKT